MVFENLVLTYLPRQAMEWGFFVLAFSFLLARFWVRLSLRQYQAWVSDVLLIVALVCTAGNIMCDTLIYKVDGLLEYKHVTQYLGKVSGHVWTDRLASVALEMDHG